LCTLLKFYYILELGIVYMTMKVVLPTLKKEEEKKLSLIFK